MLVGYAVLVDARFKVEPFTPPGDPTARIDHGRVELNIGHFMVGEASSSP